MGLNLYWLPETANWKAALRAVLDHSDLMEAWSCLVGLANSRLDFIQTQHLDNVLRRLFGKAPPPGLTTKPIRLGILGSSTVTHLLPAIRVAGLRRNLWITAYQTDYGQYMQELLDTESGLYHFKPTTILFMLDSHHATEGANAKMRPAEAVALSDGFLERVQQCWRIAKGNLKCSIVHQTLLPVFPALLGSNEHRLVGSRDAMIQRINTALRPLADAEAVDLLALDANVNRYGIDSWYSPSLWHRAKQEIAPPMAPLYGELVGRILAARHGRFFKCLILDLDNTLWGGVIGDDGLDRIVLGQGSPTGEAFIDFHIYARELSRRGVILAVCSKNDEANALAPFEQHPEMVLQRSDIASFVANWDDKATNIRRIAAELNIGIDSIVFVDDNPFERNLVRQALPMIAVPELPEDPALYARCIADGGYFEGVAITEEDSERTEQYQANRKRENLKNQATNLTTYLRGLDMRLIWSRFDEAGLQRVVQLINKTNQFNLTTRRYTEEDVKAVMVDPDAFGLQVRLRDRFGDNGIIAIVIGRRAMDGTVLIDTWLMSCRVLGRQVEATTLNLIAAEARRLGASKLIGEYRPTSKNDMVREHYQRLGFTLEDETLDGYTRYALNMASWEPVDTFITVEEAKK